LLAFFSTSWAALTSVRLFDSLHALLATLFSLACFSFSVFRTRLLPSLGPGFSLRSSFLPSGLSTFAALFALRLLALSLRSLFLSLFYSECFRLYATFFVKQNFIFDSIWLTCGLEPLLSERSRTALPTTAKLCTFSLALTSPIA
jgi:hypothetical protein